MPYTVLLLLTRAPHLSPTRFKHHFETKHLPLVKQLFGPLTPVPKRRWYLARQPQDSSTNSTSPDTSSSDASSAAQGFIPLMLKGDPATIDFDCVCELEWESEEVFRKFQEMLRVKENRERVARDQEEFMGEERILVVGEVESGLPEGW